MSFAESSAAVFSNSFLGLMTNKESALSALASAITGKSPYSDLRIEESRSPRVAVKHSGVAINSETDYGLLGYIAGKIAKDSLYCFFRSEKRDGNDACKSDFLRPRNLRILWNVYGWQ